MSFHTKRDKYKKSVAVCLALVLLVVSTHATDGASRENLESCKLLPSCLQAALDAFASCDDVLKAEKTLCWQELEANVVLIRDQKKKRLSHLSRCLDEEPRQTDNTLTGGKMKSECERMVSNYKHIIKKASYDWDKYKLRKSAKGRKGFNKCISLAKKSIKYCDRLAGCCPKERRCHWSLELTKEQTSTTLAAEKATLYEAKQQCLLSNGGQTYWEFVEAQPFWME